MKRFCFAMLFGMSPAAFAGFLSMPLSCGDSGCSFVYDRGAYVSKYELGAGSFDGDKSKWTVSIQGT